MSAESRPSVVVVGAGIAGIATALAIRALDSGQRVLVVDDADEDPYDRTSLSKPLALNSGKISRPYAPGVLADNGIELRLGTRIGAVSSANRLLTATTAGESSEIQYSELIVATGSTPRTLGIRGVNCYWRAADFRFLQARIGEIHDRKLRVEIIGGGLVAAELADTLSHHLPVSVFMRKSHLLGRQFGPTIGRYLTDILRSRVEFHSAHEATADPERALVFEAVGADPNVPDAFLELGLQRDGRGAIVCDHAGRTSEQHVWAIGDVAGWPTSGSTDSVNSTWIRNAARVLGRNVALGDDSKYLITPFLTTRIDGHLVQAVGTVNTSYAQPSSDGQCVYFASASGDLVGAAAVDDPGAIRRVRLGLEEGKRVSI